MANVGHHSLTSVCFSPRIDSVSTFRCRAAFYILVFFLQNPLQPKRTIYITHYTLKLMGRLAFLLQCLIWSEEVQNRGEVHKHHRNFRKEQRISLDNSDWMDLVGEHLNILPIFNQICLRCFK